MASERLAYCRSAMYSSSRDIRSSSSVIVVRCMCAPRPSLRGADPHDGQRTRLLVATWRCGKLPRCATSTPSTLRIGQRYRPSRLNGPYDALVIGSGIGGLTTAALLAELGWRVAVLEQHYTAGGATHSYDRAGYEWDVGVHYIGDMGTRTTVRRMMDFLTQGNLDWAPMDAHYDRFFIGDNVYDAVAGREAFRDNLVGTSRAKRRRSTATSNCSAKCRAACAPSRSTARCRRGPRRWRVRCCAAGCRSSFDRTTWEVLSELTDDPELIAVLTGQWGDLGLPPKRSSFVIQALIARHYLHGGFYPVGGAWRIAETILPRIRARAAKCSPTRASTKSWCATAACAAACAWRTATRSTAGCVISDAGAINTFAQLLPAEVSRTHGYDRAAARR